ncbi:MAG: Gfo/Idh/MocA family oxidoreductase [Clostridia bacterium]|nr:Gfo/Idh/MocA family oxidoreductase [Clostridia bacterium]
MIRIGTVNIDTSHAPSFAEILLKGDRARYTAIYNDGFRTDSEVDDFIKKYGLEKRYYDLSEMAENIDVAFIQSCDWDRHIELCTPFIEKNVPVFIDKPIVGNLRDARKIAEWAAAGKVILGTSAMRYTYEHDDFFAQSSAEDIISVTATVGVDEFNYAIHAVEEILGFVKNSAPVSTEFVGANDAGGVEVDSYRVLFENGVSAYYHICKKGWQPSTAIVMTKKTTFVYKIDSNKVYEAMLKQVCNYFEGKENSMASVESMLDAVKIMLAGIKSRKYGGAQPLGGLTENDPCFDGYKFYLGYKAANGH